MTIHFAIVASSTLVTLTYSGAECLNSSRWSASSCIFLRFWQMRHYFWFNLHLAADKAEVVAWQRRGRETAVGKDSIGYGWVAARDASLLLAGSRAHELTTLCIGCHFGERQILHMSLAAVWGEEDGECERVDWLELPVGSVALPSPTASPAMTYSCQPLTNGSTWMSWRSLQPVRSPSFECVSRIRIWIWS